MREAFSYVVVCVPACQVRAEDEVMPVLLQHGWRFSPITRESKGDFGDVEVIVRQGHDASAI